MKLFGYHFIVRNKEELEKNVLGAVKYLAPLGVTHLVIEINNSFAFTSHPEISTADITREDLRKAAKALCEVGIEPIPLYNCVGHQGWKERNSLLKAYPEFDEAPHIPDEGLVAKEHIREGDLWLTTYTPAWCSNEPKIYDVVLPVIDELVEALEAKTVHIGMDEIFLYGQCKRCRGMDPANLFRDSLMKFYDYYKEKGIDVMIWGDRLLNAKKLIGEDGPRRARYTKDFENVGTSACIDELNKDIIICDWHYDLEEEYPSAHELLSHGYTVVPSCWYRPVGSIAFWNATLDAAKKLRKEGNLPGMLVTGWGIRPIDDLFGLSDDKLDEREINLRKTLVDVSVTMKDYFAKM